LMAPAIILAPSAPSMLFEILRLVTSLSEEPSPPLFVCEESSILLPVIEGARGARGGGGGQARKREGER
jgi:hypothetical protein